MLNNRKVMSVLAAVVILSAVILFLFTIPTHVVQAEDGCEPCDIPSPVVIEGAPVCGFTIDNPKGPAPLTVTFTYVGDHEKTYFWDFGDNTPGSTEENPIHVYTGPGDFIATQWVFNKDMSFCWHSYPIHVTPQTTVTPEPEDVGPEPIDDWPAGVTEISDCSITNTYGGSLVICGGNTVTITNDDHSQTTQTTPLVTVAQTKIPTLWDYIKLPFQNFWKLVIATIKGIPLEYGHW